MGSPGHTNTLMSQIPCHHPSVVYLFNHTHILSPSLISSAQPSNHTPSHHTPFTPHPFTSHPFTPHPFTPHPHTTPLHTTPFTPHPFTHRHWLMWSTNTFRPGSHTVSSWRCVVLCAPIPCAGKWGNSSVATPLKNETSTNSDFAPVRLYCLNTFKNLLCTWDI